MFKQFTGNHDVHVGAAIKEMFRRCGPIQVQSLESPELLERTEPFRRPGEGVQQLIARTGVSPSQIMTWRTDRLAAFIAQAERNNEADGVVEPHTIHAEVSNASQTESSVG